MTGAALLAQPLLVLGPAVASTPSQSTPAEIVTERPDFVSAMTTARAQGARVEIVSERTEFSTSYANPDGSITTDAHSGPIRFRDEDGALLAIDTALAAPAADGSVKPRRHPRGLRLSGKTSGATEEFVTVEEGAGRQVAFGWGKKLPKPTVDGDTATWAEISPGVDMQVHSLPTGFEQTFVLRERPTGAVSWQFPIRTKGLTPRAEADGSISFLNAEGKVVSTIPAAIAWDAAIDPNTGDRASVSPVELTIVQKSKNRSILTVTPDAAWITDPARVTPITVDPTYKAETLSANMDTWVQQGYSSGQPSDPELKLGNNGAGQVARSFLRFPITAVMGKKIMSASLNLYATHSWSCSARSWEVWNTARPDTDASWSDQPAWNSKIVASSTTKGYSSSCANGWTSVDIKSAVETWAASSSDANRGLGLRATSESDEYAWKKFSSNNGSNPPYISYTWDRPPGTPQKPTIDGAVSFAPPSGGSSIPYTTDRTPMFTTSATDADKNTVRYGFEVRASSSDTAPVVDWCRTAESPPTGYVASGTPDGCAIDTQLSDNTRYWVRTRAFDGFVYGPWSSMYEFRVGAAQPAQPTVACVSPYDHQSWFALAPAGNIGCTVTLTGTGYSSPGWVRIAVDGGTELRTKINPPSGTTTFAVQVPATLGRHSVIARAESPAGRLSVASAKYEFGFGTAATEPAQRPRFDTVGPVPVEFSGPPRGTGSAPTAIVQWRVAGSTSGWNTSTHATVPAVSDSNTAIVTVDGVWRSDLETRDVLAQVDTPADEPVLLEMQGCLVYTAATHCTWDTTPIVVQRVPAGFAGGGPTAPAGPGEVNLRTGEFSIGATDVSIPGLTGTLDVGRWHTTDVDAESTAAGVFGPGWVSALDADSDLGGTALVDSTLEDGSLVFTDPTGAVVSFRSENGRRTGASLADDYQPVLADGEETIGTLNVAVVGAKTTARFTGVDGATTTFVATQEPAAGVPARFAVDASDADPTLPGAIEYLRDDSGRVTHIVAASPALSSGCTLPTNPGDPWAVGCRILRLVYETANGTGSPDRLKRVYAVLGNGPERLAASYGYSNDAAARLISATDELTGLSTQYEYVVDSAVAPALTRLSKITPPGLEAISFVYSGTGTNAKLTKVTRPRPAGDPTGGTVVLASFVYGIPTGGTAATSVGLPDLSAAKVADWNQTRAPGYGAAVFGPDHPAPTGNPAAADWPHASLVYTDDVWGRTLNTAVHGAGAWQLTATDYDQDGNVVRELDTRAMALLANDPDDVVTDGAGADQLSTQTYYHPELTEGDDLVVPGGMLVTDVYGPGRYAYLANGTREWVRPHVHTDYGQGAPAGADPFARWLPTTTRTTAFVDLETPEEQISLVRIGYGAIQTGDPTGWDLGAPTSTTIDMPTGTPDIVRITRYDADGRVVETRQPMSNGADAGARKTTYYSAGASKSACQWSEWIGLPCRTAPGDDAASVLPTTTITYTDLLAPATVVETAAGAIRTTTTSYYDDGRTKDVAVGATGLTGSTPVAATRTKYDQFTGLPVELVQLSGTVETATRETAGYDGWGRVVSYVPSGGGLTSTAYDAAGRVASKTDPKGTTTWTYDGTDANGLAENRGLPTGMAVTNPGGAAVIFTAAYDASGARVKQTLPGGLVQRVGYDAAGGLQTLTYSGQVVDGEGATVQDVVWLGWNNDRDVAGRVVREWTPGGAAFDSAVGDAIAYDRQYGYDGAGRLVQVKDRTAAGTDVVASDPENPATLLAACQTRIYAFDSNGNRTSLRKIDAAGACASTGGTTKAWTYNGADRLVGGANGSGTYFYDKLGRTTSIPSVDTPKGTGDLTIGYYDTDAARSISQTGTGAQTTTYDLDVAGRRLTASSGPTGGNPTATLTRHYTDGSDNPGWVANTTGTGTVITRYAGSLGSVNATITGTAVSLALADPHGDNVTTVTVPASGNATGIDAWSDSDEYGNPRNAAAAKTVGGATGYGWLGAHERGNDDSGLALMGARLYNPSTGQFTSTDPEYRGNETAYSYPGDPVNSHDVTGRRMYTLNYDLGYFGASANSFFAELKFRFGDYFLRGAPARLTMGASFDVSEKLWGKVPAPKWQKVTVTDITLSGFRLDAQFPHVDGGGNIRFTFTRKTNGHLNLRIHASVPWASFCWLSPINCQLGWTVYVRGVKSGVWNGLASRLRGLVEIMNSVPATKT
ncbi:MAG: DNRLRE domain-containing protein [Sporichthyaceae bacterium]